MSVMIKGAKPPSGCAFCYFNDDSKCALIPGCNYDETNGWQRREDCPLIELPDHGDLIDRDEYRRAAGMAPHCQECSRKHYAAMFICPVARECGEIDRAHVVIPAERSENEEP